jgi:peptide/nickel transport system permease protein
MNRAVAGPLAALLALCLIALAAPVLPLPNPVTMDVAHRLTGSSAAHVLGQDEFGRDVLARLVWGARTSLAVALAATAIACVVGTALGLIGGFLRGIAELLAVRSMDVVLCFPPLLLAVLVVTLAGPGAMTLIAVLSVLFLPGFVRVAYAGVLTTRQLDYVEALRVLGANPVRVMLRTVLPNIAGPLLVQASLAAASAVVLEAGLSFLGLGVVPPTPSWGLMVRAARQTMAQSPLLLLWPCLALVATIFILNTLCDGLQVWLDPHGATRSLWRRRAVKLAPALQSASNTALSIEGLTLELDTPSGPVRPVRDITLSVEAGETLALVGESGSGKSLTGLAVLGLLPPVVRPVAGVVSLAGTELLRLPEPARRRLRGGQLAMVFQDPASSLNPVHRIGDQIAEAIRAHGGNTSVEKLLAEVGIPDPARRARAYPHQLSGGMRQRVMIAMAIANNPSVLIADEPTTALDVTVQAQVIDLLLALQRQHGLGMVFITHNLPLVAEIAGRVAVMYAGEIVEQGPTAALFAEPLHPYTSALLRSAVAEAGTSSAPEGIPGSVPAPGALPPGCVFAPRCRHRMPACEAAHPPLREVAPGRLTRCIRWQEAA